MRNTLSREPTRSWTKLFNENTTNCASPGRRIGEDRLDRSGGQITRQRTRLSHSRRSSRLLKNGRVRLTLNRESDSYAAGAGTARRTGTRFHSPDEGTVLLCEPGEAGS